jgi:hypothetical protein
MNTKITPLLAECEALGIRIVVEDKKLAADAPKGAVTPELLGRLREHKAALVKALTPPA